MTLTLHVHNVTHHVAVATLMSLHVNSQKIIRNSNLLGKIVPSSYSLAIYQIMICLLWLIKVNSNEYVLYFLMNATRSNISH